MRFSILIPTTGRADLVRMAVHSVLRQTYTGPVEIVVTDTASSSAVPDMLRAKFPATPIIYAKVPHGDPSLGWDFAYQQSSGDYVLWLDDDNYLLPWALEVFERAIKKTNAQYITGHHVYYYDQHHPLSYMRNILKIESLALFDGKIQILDPHHLAQSFLYYPLDNVHKHFKIHPAATIIARSILEKIRKELGFVVVPHMRCNHSGNFLNVWFADTAVGIGVPLSIVGRLGQSFTQKRSTASHEHAWWSPFSFQHSPLHGNVYINHVLESVLSAQTAVKSRSVGTLVVRRFLPIYAAQLVSVPHSLRVMRHEWRELLRFMETKHAKIPKKTRKNIHSLQLLAYLLQPLKSWDLWPYVSPYIFIKKNLTQSIRFILLRNLQRLLTRVFSRRLTRSGHRDISLKTYHLYSITDVAQNFQRIYTQETGYSLNTRMS